jgi:hypothetical protein
MSDVLDLRSSGFDVVVTFDDIPTLIGKLNEHFLEYRSRAFRAKVEAIVEGTDVTVAYVQDRPESPLVEIGLIAPSFGRNPSTRVWRCSHYPERALDYARYITGKLSHEEYEASHRRMASGFWQGRHHRQTT